MEFPVYQMWINGSSIIGFFDTKKDRVIYPAKIEMMQVPVPKSSLAIPGKSGNQPDFQEFPALLPLQYPFSESMAPIQRVSYVSGLQAFIPADHFKALYADFAETAVIMYSEEGNERPESEYMPKLIELAKTNPRVAKKLGHVKAALDQRAMIEAAEKKQKEKMAEAPETTGPGVEEGDHPAQKENIIQM